MKHEVDKIQQRSIMKTRANNAGQKSGRESHARWFGVRKTKQRRMIQDEVTKMKQHHDAQKGISA